jgi:hypothetical protein
VFLKSSSALNTPKTKISTEFPYETKQNKTNYYKKCATIVKQLQSLAQFSRNGIPFLDESYRAAVGF